tara:strand:- start:307 stop:1056 length:750 start_codon:yes stop_codon:yes gene_type:complete
MLTYSEIKIEIEFLETHLKRFNRIAFNEKLEEFDSVLFQNSFSKLINYNKTKNELAFFLEEQVEQNNSIVLENINTKLKNIISLMIFTVKKYEALDIKEYENLYDFYRELIAFFLLKIYNDLTFSTSDFYSIIPKIFSLEDEKKKINETHPAIFEDGVFEIFKKWIEISKETPNKKLSFIFQKIKKDNLLRKSTFKDLINWASKNNFIDDESYIEMLELGHFVSPSKILSQGRLDKYQTMLENHFPEFR